MPNAQFPNNDTFELAREDNIEVRSLRGKILGGGVLHTKVWIVDRKHMYVGSANFDWRALTEVCTDSFSFYFCVYFDPEYSRVIKGLSGIINTNV